MLFSCLFCDHRKSDLGRTELPLAAVLEAGKSKARELAPAESVAWLEC